jgi:hypothetical protein
LAGALAGAFTAALAGVFFSTVFDAAFAGVLGEALAGVFGADFEVTFVAGKTFLSAAFFVVLEVEALDFFVVVLDLVTTNPPLNNVTLDTRA